MPRSSIHDRPAATQAQPRGYARLRQRLTDSHIDLGAYHLYYSVAPTGALGWDDLSPRQQAGYRMAFELAREATKAAGANQ